MFFAIGCSHGRINENRVCDIYFVKTENDDLQKNLLTVLDVKEGNISSIERTLVYALGKTESMRQKVRF